MWTSLIVFLILILLVIYYFLIGKYWLQSLLSGVKISNKDILFMYFRKIPVKRVINLTIKLKKAGLDVDLNKIQAHYLAGGKLDDLGT